MTKLGKIRNFGARFGKNLKAFDIKVRKDNLYLEKLITIVIEKDVKKAKAKRYRD